MVANFAASDLAMAIGSPDLWAGWSVSFHAGGISVPTGRPPCMKTSELADVSFDDWVMRAYVAPKFGD